MSFLNGKQLAFLATLMMASASASAANVTFNIGANHTGGNHIHAGNACNNFDFYMCGQPMTPVTGTIVFQQVTTDADGNVLNVGDVYGSVAGGTEELVFTDIDFRPDAQIGSRPWDVLMRLGYTRYDGGVEQESGSLWFAAFDPDEPYPSTLSLTSLMLWGNNWHNSYETMPDYAFGLDLNAVGVVPSPPALLLFATGLIALFGWGLRRNRSARTAAA